MTVFAGWYIYSKMQKVKKILLEEQEERKRRKAEQLAGEDRAMQPMNMGMGMQGMGVAF